MRWMLAVLVLLVCGCTPVRLQVGTVRQGATLSDIQYQQVLENLAHFSCDPNALAWHVKVTGGLVQVSDSGAASLVPSAVRSPLIAPNLGVTRNVLGQWNVDTVIESDDLELLQLAYQKAIDPTDARREIKKKVMEKVCELACEHHVVLARELVDEMIETFKFNASPGQTEKLNRIHARLAELYTRVATLMGKDALVQRMPTVVPAAVNLTAATQPAGPRIEALPTPPSAESELLATKKEIIRVVASISSEPFLGDPLEKQLRGPLRIEQAEDKIRALVELVGEKGEEPNAFATPWVHCGRKHDVPRCACYVGHYKGCQGDCYAWVMPEKAKILRDFILTILNLAPPEPQEFSSPRGVGAAFSPNS